MKGRIRMECSAISPRGAAPGADPGDRRSAQWEPDKPINIIGCRGPAARRRTDQIHACVPAPILGGGAWGQRRSSSMQAAEPQARLGHPRRLLDAPRCTGYYLEPPNAIANYANYTVTGQVRIPRDDYQILRCANCSGARSMPIQRNRGFRASCWRLPGSVGRDHRGDRGRHVLRRRRSPAGRPTSDSTYRE